MDSASIISHVAPSQIHLNQNNNKSHNEHDQSSQDQILKQQMYTESVADIVDYSKKPKQVFFLAKKWLKYCAQKYGGYSRIAVIFDIDETLLLAHKNDTHITHHPVGYLLYEYCRKHHIDIHLITARVGDNNSKEYVRDQLRRLGYEGYKSLYMVNSRHQDDATPALFKGKCRKTIARDSQKTIALNVGDQHTDIFADYDQISDDVKQLLSSETYYFLKVKDDYATMSLKFSSSKDCYE